MNTQKTEFMLSNPQGGVAALLESNPPDASRDDHDGDDGDRTGASPALAEPTRTPLTVYLLVTLYAAGILLPFLGSSRVLTHHEVYVSLPAREMLQNRDWVFPTYAHNRWLAKPPLAYWLTDIVALARGGTFDEWTARLPAVFSAIAICIAVTRLAGQWFGATTALLAGLIQASAVYTYMQGRLGEIDMPLACFFTWAVVVIAPHWIKDRPRLPLGAASAFYVLAALAILAKGPAAGLLLVCFVLGWCIARLSIQPLISLLLTPAILLFLVVVLPWPIALISRVGWDLVWTDWYNEYVRRASGSHSLGIEPPWFYFQHVPWMILPWTLVLLVGAPRLWRALRADLTRRHLYVWTWFLSGFIGLSLVFGKHMHYVIPALPPLSILTAVLLTPANRTAARKAAPWLATVFCVALVGCFIVSAWLMPAHDHRRSTAAFVHRATEALPRDATLCVANMGQMPFYFYITRDYKYVDAISDAPAGDDVYVLTKESHAADTAAANGFHEMSRETGMSEAAAEKREPFVLLTRKVVEESDGVTE